MQSELKTVIYMKTTNLTFQTVLLGIFIVLAIVSLAFQSVELSWAIVALAIINTSQLVLKHGIIWWKGRNHRVAIRERFLMFLLCLMVFFLTTGTALYLWAFQLENIDTISKNVDERFLFINAEYLLRSVVCSFQLFAASIDSNVLDGIKGHEYVKGMISLQAVLSFSCTIAVLISLAYARLRAFVKLHKLTMVDQEHNHLYVFFGINEPSRLLAKSINNRNDRKSLVLFVENIHVDEEDHGGWNSIVSMITHRRQTFSVADELNARVTFTETRLCDVDINELEDDKEGEKDVLNEINLVKLKELLLKLKEFPNDAKLHIFFFSDKEEENIQAMSILAKDATIHDLKVNGIEQRFYCHARQNGLNGVVEDIAVKRGLEVRIIDSSHLAIELLKADGRNHPVKLVETDKDNPTTVKSEFNSLIVGFDEAGQDALKFLYEFGAFVSSEGTPEKEIRSPFHCIAIDKRMDELRGVFSTCTPAAMNQKNKDASSLIRLEQCDCMSSEFYNSVLDSHMRKTINYVVITIGNDDLGMMLAIRILNHIRKVREDLSRLKIYVRSYNPGRESYMQKIADYYNEGYNQDCIKSKKEDFLSEAIIIPFGQIEKIYTYEMIVMETLIEQGKIFQKRYCEINKEKELWNLRRELLTGAKRKVILEENGEETTIIEDVPEEERKVSLVDIRSLKRKESQDLANALHAQTKICLLKDSLKGICDWNVFVKKYFDVNGDAPNRIGKFDKICYKGFVNDEKELNENIENKIILNLARLEHIRWVASHEMLGYIETDKNVHKYDERTMQHNCMRPWEELDKESKIVSHLEKWECDYKAYDFGVVDVSVWLNKKQAT